LKADILIVTDGHCVLSVAPCFFAVAAPIMSTPIPSDIISSDVDVTKCTESSKTKCSLFAENKPDSICSSIHHDPWKTRCKLFDNSESDRLAGNPFSGINSSNKVPDDIEGSIDVTLGAMCYEDDHFPDLEKRYHICIFC